VVAIERLSDPKHKAKSGVKWSALSVILLKMITQQRDYLQSHSRIVEVILPAFILPPLAPL
jgi:hypothetical protein